mgnify:FL=1
MRRIWLSWSLLSRPRKSGTPEIILRKKKGQISFGFLPLNRRRRTHSAMMHPADRKSVV